MIPSRHDYKLQLVSKTEHFLKRMRWKALQFDGKLPPSDKETYGFRTRKCPSTIEGLKKFEEDMWKLVRNIEFRYFSNDLQNKMKTDIQSIRQSGKVAVAADKSNNLYKLDKKDYDKLINNSITSTYKKSNDTHIRSINEAGKLITERLQLADRMEILQNSEAYITLKDHKDDFSTKPSVRLINPSKTDIGKVSKILLERINKDLLAATGVSQWKNTNAVIKWFEDIRVKRHCTFLQFDIESFYPSITLELFNKAITYARGFIDIPDSDLDIILQARRTLLFHKDEPWTKKNDNDDFDVPMGSYDGAEVCELVGIFLLSELSNITNKKDVGLYRDDGLALLRKAGGPDIERLKKKIYQLFKKHGLTVVISNGLKIAQFLDTELNLTNGTYKPYRKPGNDPLYVDSKSNHPPAVLKHIPRGVAKRLSDISSSEEIFNNAVPVYEEALKRSGFTEKLKYEKSDSNRESNEGKRRREIIWFNPPYSANVKTNIGQEFFRLLRTHFHSDHRYHRIFNKNKVKLSYSCMRNVSSYISGHNRNVLGKEPANERMCNCRNPDECPLSNECLSQNIVYKSTVTTIPDDSEKDYLGNTSGKWKNRRAVHRQDFNHRGFSKRTELAKHIWSVKDSGKTYSLKWDIYKKVRGRKVGGACKLCMTEKLAILDYPEQDRLLNSNHMEKCVHERKFMLANYEGPSDTLD